MVKENHQIITEQLGGCYGMIVDRREEYSVMPVPVFEFLNSWEPLKAIVIVTHRSMSKKIAEIDQSLSNKPLVLMDNVDQAQVWIDDKMRAY